MSVWKTYSSLRTGRDDVKLQGTVTHIPPERLNDHTLRLHETADVYAFGILTWEILTGKRPVYAFHFYCKFKLMQYNLNETKKAAYFNY